MVEIIILTLILLTLAAIGGWVEKHSRTADRVCRMLEGFIARATESIAWAIMEGK